MILGALWCRLKWSRRAPRRSLRDGDLVRRMPRRTQDSVLISTLAVAVIVGKIVSAALHQPRAASEFDALAEPASISAAEPFAGITGAAIEQPVQSGPCSPGEANSAMTIDPPAVSPSHASRR
jgi:hypothetical protein